LATFFLALEFPSIFDRQLGQPIFLAARPAPFGSGPPTLAKVHGIIVTPDRLPGGRRTRIFRITVGENFSD
jgi:hypothetical protein